MERCYRQHIRLQKDSACPECQIPPAMPGTEKTSLPTGRSDIEGGLGGPDSAGEAVETAGAPMKCSPMVSSRAGNTGTSTQAKYIKLVEQ